MNGSEGLSVQADGCPSVGARDGQQRLGASMADGEQSQIEGAGGADDKALALTELEQWQALVQLHRELLADVALKRDHQAVLDRLCEEAERLVPGALASVMLFRPIDGRLYVQSAPSAPKEAIVALNGLQLGHGSCGNAVCRNEPVFVGNTSEDDTWEPIIDFAHAFNIRACWSFPVRDGDKAIGSFALSSFEPGRPTSFQRMVLDICASITGIVLQRQQREYDLHAMSISDGLTGLPNREELARRYQRKCAHWQRFAETKSMALGFIDVDDFSSLVAEYGYPMTDRLLQSIARRLEKQLPEAAVLGRLGADRFVLLVDKVLSKRALREDLQLLCDAAKRGFEVDGQRFVLSMRAAVRVISSPDEDFELALNGAERLLQQPNASGQPLIA